MGNEQEIENLSKMMEEMASSPTEPHVRQPGEKGMYEIQREDFARAREALRKAHVPGPYKAIQAP